MKSYAFLFWAYNVIWIGLVAYVFYLVSRLRRIDRRLDSVESAMDRSRGKKSRS